MYTTLSESSPVINFTDDALAHIRELIIENGDYGLKLRVAVSGGGCSCFQYGFSFEDTIEEDNFQMEQGGVAILVDATSMQYLAGAEISYETTGESKQLIIKNVSAATSCGCGNPAAA